MPASTTGVRVGMVSGFRLGSKVAIILINGVISVRRMVNRLGSRASGIMPSIGGGIPPLF